MIFQNHPNTFLNSTSAFKPLPGCPSCAQAVSSPEDHNRWSLMIAWAVADFPPWEQLPQLFQRGSAIARIASIPIEGWAWVHAAHAQRSKIRRRCGICEPQLQQLQSRCYRHINTQKLCLDFSLEIAGCFNSLYLSLSLSLSLPLCIHIYISFCLFLGPPLKATWSGFGFEFNATGQQVVDRTWCALAVRHAALQWAYTQGVVLSCMPIKLNFVRNLWKEYRNQYGWKYFCRKRSDRKWQR